MRCAVLSIVSVVAVASAPRSATLRVPSEYATINEGLDAAAAGDTVLVAPGTYTDYETRLIDPGNGLLIWDTSCAFMKDEVTLRSEGGSAVTTIDLDGQGSTPRHPVLCALLYSGQVAVEGFRIQGSGSGQQAEVFIQACNRVTIRDCQFEGADSGSHPGGAIYALDGEVFVEGCVFRDCTASQGSAIFSYDCDLIVLDSVFESCSDGAVATMGGFGVRRFVLRDSRFMGNEHAVVASRQDVITIEDSWFEGNRSAPGSGGAAVAISTPTSTGTAAIRRNVFWKNRCVDLTSGAVLWLGYPGVLHRNVFYGNSQESAAAGGSAFGIGPPASGVITVSNNVVAGNVGGAAALSSASHPPASECNIFWANPAGDFLNYVPGTTDLVVDPRFCGPETGDFTVRDNSPCLPENSGACGPIGPFGRGCGSVSVIEESWGKLKAKYRD